MSQALRDYFDAIIPVGAEGYLHVALGLEPYLDKHGKYKHKQWIPRRSTGPRRAATRSNGSRSLHRTATCTAARI